MSSQFLAAHHWVASIEQLRELKVSTLGARRTPGASARSISPVHGVGRRAAASSSTLEGRALLAQLAAGREAFVSGPTAGALHGLRGDADGDRSRSRSSSGAASCCPADCRLVRTSWIDEERDVVRPGRRDPRSPRRCGCCSGWPASSTSSASSGRPRTCGTRGSSRPSRRGSTSSRSAAPAAAASSGWPTGWSRPRVRDRPAQSGLELDLLAIDRAGRPAGAGSASTRCACRPAR